VEQTGGKLIWGCMVFYPFFYPLGALFSAGVPVATGQAPLVAVGGAACGGAAALFATGWVLTRGANLQVGAVRAL
jgi:hypothetical protein